MNEEISIQNSFIFTTDFIIIYTQYHMALSITSHEKKKTNPTF